MTLSDFNEEKRKKTSQSDKLFLVKILFRQMLS